MQLLKLGRSEIVNGKINKMIIALDSNVFISALSSKEEQSLNAQRLVREIAVGKHQAIASSVVFGEVYSVKVKNQPLDLEGFFFQINNLKTVPANDSVCLMAGELRLKYGPALKLPDAVHLATALDNDVNLFVTNDRQFAKIAQKLIPTKLLSQVF